MPTSLAEDRRGARLTLVRASVPVASTSMPRSAGTQARPLSDAPAAPRASVAQLPAPPSGRRVAGAVLLVTALGTVLLAALAASATLAWAGG